MPNAGDVVRASDNTRYICKATQSTTQSINSATFTAIQFNGTDDVDDLGIHDPVTNNSRINIGLNLGWWWVSAKYVTQWSAASQGRRARIVMNGTTGVNGGYTAQPTLVTGTGASGGFWVVETTTFVQSTLTADYVELHGFQDSGGALSTLVSGDLRSQFVAMFLHS